MDRYINFISDEESEEGFPESFKALPSVLPRRLTQREIGLVKAHEADLLGKCPVTIDHTGKIKDGTPMRAAVCGDKKMFLTGESALREYLMKADFYNKVTIPVKEPPEVTELANDKIDNMERAIGDLENAMGPTLPKALVELGRRRPRFFRVTPKRSALI